MFSNVCCSHTGFLSNISISVPFQWNVLSAISVSQIFSWDIGEGPLCWYMVESQPCTDPGCCSVISVSRVSYTEVQTILASSVQHLCDRLREQRFNRQIVRVRR